MLDEHKCHPAIRRHVLEKRREGVQSAGGRADPNDQPARFSRSGGDNLDSYSDLPSDQGLLRNVKPGLFLVDADHLEAAFTAGRNASDRLPVPAGRLDTPAITDCRY
jgi:hypothetical protein